MEKERFLPTLLWFAMTNTFSGSCGDFRFMAKPNVIMATPKEVDFVQSTISCEYWHGKLCYELSEMEEKREFPLTEEVRQEMMDWLLANI